MTDILFYTPTMFSPTHEYREIPQGSVVRIYGEGWVQPASKSNFFRHPFNIITEEIYD